MNVRIHKNDDEGLQAEWRGVLLTLRPNHHHGVSGSIAIKDDDGSTIILNFHGQTGKIPFPMEFHEEAMNDSDGKEDAS